MHQEGSFPGSVFLKSCFAGRDRKSTRLNSSHSQISYAVFCLKKKKQRQRQATHLGPTVRFLAWHSALTLRQRRVTQSRCAFALARFNSLKLHLISLASV